MVKFFGSLNEDAGVAVFITVLDDSNTCRGTRSVKPDECPPKGGESLELRPTSFQGLFNHSAQVSVT
jgi:hypothetical protein